MGKRTRLASTVAVLTKTNTVKTGFRGISVTGPGGVAITGPAGSAVTGPGGVTVTGDYGRAVIGHGGIGAAGHGGIMTFHLDEAGTRTITTIAGPGGVEPDVFYTVRDGRVTRYITPTP